MGETSTNFLSLQLIYIGHLQFEFRNLSFWFAGAAGSPQDPAYPHAVRDFVSCLEQNIWEFVSDVT